MWIFGSFPLSAGELAMLPGTLPSPGPSPARRAFWHVLVAAFAFTAASRACRSRWVFLCLFLVSFCSLITSGKSQGKEMPSVAGAGGGGGGSSHGMLQRSKLACAKLFWPVPQLCRRNEIASRKDRGPITPIPSLHPLNPKSLLSSHPAVSHSPPQAQRCGRAVSFCAPSSSFASSWH